MKHKSGDDFEGRTIFHVTTHEHTAKHVAAQHPDSKLHYSEGMGGSEPGSGEHYSTGKHIVTIPKAPKRHDHERGMGE